MDYVQWCDFILRILYEDITVSTRNRMIGVNAADIARSIATASPIDAPEPVAILTSLRSLEECGLVDSGESGVYWRLTSMGRDYIRDAVPTWSEICKVHLEFEHITLLEAVNDLSIDYSDRHPKIKHVTKDDLCERLEWIDPDLPYVIARELTDKGFVLLNTFLSGDFYIQSTYSGVVWETRRGFTLQSAFIDSLVAEWETTNVDFKRELSIDTADEKREFVKDMIGLANTKASGKRWLVIGIDDRTRGYYGPPDPRITQNRLEQLLSRYTDPVVDIRYEVADYRSGPVGLLEVVRNSEKLPYRVAKALTGKKRIDVGQVFVRHGSQTEEPTEAERLALQEEGDRARSLTQVN